MIDALLAFLYTQGEVTPEEIVVRFRAEKVYKVTMAIEFLLAYGWVYKTKRGLKLTIPVRNFMKKQQEG